MVVVDGYVRQAPLATQYYERDFDYDEHLVRVAPILLAQQEAASRLPAASRAVLPPPLPPLEDDADDDEDAPPTSSSSLPAAAPPASTTTTTTSNAWEDFFREHSTARFFRERRYFPLAFPALAEARSVLEIGAGAGAALLPVLRASPSAVVVATDVSASSLAQLRRCAADALGEEEARRRVATAVADGAAESPEAFVASVGRGLLLQRRQRQRQRERRRGAGGRSRDSRAAEEEEEENTEGEETPPPPPPTTIAGSFDAVILAFTLSAVAPGEPMRRMLRNAAACLKPGKGVLCLRDHALGDLVQLRIPAHQALPGYHSTYVRGDGTLAHFFEPRELERLAGEAGFDVEEERRGAGAEKGGAEDGATTGTAGRLAGCCRVACVINRNRRTGQELRRAFVTATFRRRRREDDGGGGKQTATR